MRSRAAAAFAGASFLMLTVGPPPALAKTAGNEPLQVSVVAHPMGPTNSVLYVVPAGKRLVVEHFSSEVGVAADTTVNRFSLAVAADPSTPGSVLFSHFLPPTFSSPCGTCASGQVEVVASHAVRLYVEAGQALVVDTSSTPPEALRLL